jgi:geranylgeranyl pyrophosphate synthase
MGPAEDETARIARDWLTRAGKRWRPYLAACTFMALAGDGEAEAKGAAPEIPSDVKKAAVAIECFHKASLIHDDIEDGDETRYDQPALHVETGVPVALNVGDFLLGEGYRLLGELTADSEVRLAMIRTAAAGHVTLSRGQGRELAWTRRPAPLPSLEVLDIFRQKTATAFEVALRLGAYLCEGGVTVHEVLHDFSESLGIAYQIRDDLDDMGTLGGGDAGAAGDLYRARLSLLLSIAHRRAVAGPEKAIIESLVRGETRHADIAESVQRIFADRRVIEKAEELRDAYKEEAIRSLRPLTNPTLKGLLRRVVGKILGEEPIEGYCSRFEAQGGAIRSATTE